MYNPKREPRIGDTVMLCPRHTCVPWSERYFKIVAISQLTEQGPRYRLRCEEGEGATTFRPRTHFYYEKERSANV